MKIIFSENIYPKLVGYRPFLNPDEPGEICHNISQYLEASMTSYNATLMMNNNGHQNNYQDYLYMTLYIAGDANDFNSRLMCKMEYKSPATNITREYQISDSLLNMGQGSQASAEAANAIWSQIASFIKMAYMTRKNEIDLAILL